MSKTQRGSEPGVRVRALNARPMRAQGEFVLVWMVATRRPAFNATLERAAALAREFDRGLIVLEALRVDYPWASRRHHAFILEGMADNARAFARKRALYVPYVEPEPGAGKGLVEALAARAVAVVTDWWPCFFVPAMQRALAERVAVRVEAADSCGLLPLAAAGRAYARAVDFRRFVQRALPEHLDAQPRPDPLAGGRLPEPPELPRAVARRWPPTAPAALGRALAEALPVDAAVPCAEAHGGRQAGLATLVRFIDERLPRYAEDRNHPDRAATSDLSPYLHYGHVSATEVFQAVAEREDWNVSRLGENGRGKREGWWGMSVDAEAFLDQLVVWRELSFNTTLHDARADSYASLPAWARASLEEHVRDRRPALYSPGALAAAETSDEVWNAAQRQLVREGRLHGYLRMLWGKRLLEWTRTPEEALAIMTDLNHRYALDGRDPCSIAGIAWVLGRYDRPWPESPIFGSVRRMTSASTRRKLRLDAYLQRFGGT